jgi:uncharacterized protein
MPTQIFVNLPVADLDRAKAFYTALGHTVNPQFTDDNAACIVVSDTIYLMLLVEPFFSGFIPGRAIANAKTHVECLLAMSFDNRAAVDDYVTRGLAAGGTEPRPAQDHGFMYSRALADPDGHTWEPMWMDPGFVEPTV